MSQTVSRFAGQVDQAWLDRVVEPVLEPELPIIDPHHHLWIREGNVYLLPSCWLTSAPATTSSPRCSRNATRCIAGAVRRKRNPWAKRSS